ncbi:gp53-like domain-containing protein [Sphingomonas sp. 10B4]|uniref:gp53-like domain-containing protein n=1 Tax=Sphingomonas sp. 10B4 TaxID=3048575 RepID=UPI002AB452D9|nr:hypothetical protein [Sphingomonas sp. 10B4]MDY7525476.1 hypothetical protein [Sphingomonas sp. 10B4]MEB0281420.1 hypothetical protein [Sphingomonas sp. 10B4]
MNRNIVYAGSIPLETDILNLNRNTMIGLGRLAMDVLGTSTVASGLACTQTTVPSMSVAIGAGALYSMAPVDSSAYSSLPANTTDLIAKQGILSASDNKRLTLIAPGTAGTSVIYLIQGAISEVDANPIQLPYYNASNPTVAFSGPGGTGVAQNTTRPVTVNLTAKAGTAAASPTPPAADTGFVPLYYVTVSYGATTITNSNITVATGAPFLSTGLAGMMPIAGGTFTGPVAGQTPVATDNSTLLATTAFVQGLLGGSAAARGYQKFPNGTILQWGVDSTGSGSAAVVFPIPFPNAVYVVVPTISNTSAAIGAWGTVQLGAGSTLSGFNAYSASFGTASGAAANSSFQFNWIAIGS